MRRGEEPDLFGEDLFEDADSRVFTTDPEGPDDARTFVWADIRWFERMAGDEMGAITFSPVAEDEQVLREWLSQEELEITELDNDFARTVREEFQEQAPLYLEAPELSNQPLVSD